MDILSLLPLDTLGPGALLALAVVLIIRGDLVPRKTYDAVAAERDTWRTACERKDETIRDLSESAATTAAVLRSLPSPTPVLATEPTSESQQ